MMIATSAPRRSARRRLRTDIAFGNVVADLQRAVVKVARERGPIDWLRRLSPALVGGLLVGLAPASIIKFALGVFLIWSAWKVFAHREKL
jgi:hypothetical protein